MTDDNETPSPTPPTPDEPASTPPAPTPPAPPRPSNRAGKLVLLAAVLLIVAYIQFSQTKPVELGPKWTQDLQAAKDQALKEKRKVLVVFFSKPESSEDKKLIQNVLTKPKTEQALDQEKVLRVYLNTTDHAEAVKKYRIKMTPTCLYLDQFGIDVKPPLTNPTNDVSFYSDWMGITLQKKLTTTASSR